MKKIVYLNGKYINFKFAKISIEDRGFQFSDGVYEVIALKNYKFIDLNFHLFRLKKSLRELDIKYRFKNNDIIKIFKKLIGVNNFKNGLIYIQITRGVQERSHVYLNNLKPTIIIYTLIKKFNDNPNKIKCVSAITYPDLRWKRRDIKSISLLPNVLAAKAAEKKSAYEAILIQDGHITEATSSNVWIVKNKTLITHPTNSDILKGVTRDKIKILIKKFKLKLLEKKFNKKSLFNADEVFLTSSSSFVTPVIKIDNKLINNGKIGNLTYNLAKIYIHNL